MLESMKRPLFGHDQCSSVMQEDWSYLRSTYPDARLKNLFLSYPDFRKSRKAGYSLESMEQTLKS